MARRKTTQAVPASEQAKTETPVAEEVKAPATDVAVEQKSAQKQSDEAALNELQIEVENHTAMRLMFPVVDAIVKSGEKQVLTFKDADAKKRCLVDIEQLNALNGGGIKVRGAK